MTETTATRGNTPLPRILVIGAGPVGLASALLLSQQGYPVTVYEEDPELDLTSENSYPIGVNTRGQETLRRINPALLKRLQAEGDVVEAFHIYNGTRRVALLESGKLIATTRAFLTKILMEAVEADGSIEYRPGHSLRGLDLANRSLTFELQDGEQIVVDGSDARVLAADGVWSKARQSLTTQVAGFEPHIGEWGVQFRVAYSQPQTEAPGLDPDVHHIFTSKGIYTATLQDRVWGVVLTAIEGDDAEDLLLSRDASDDNIRALEAHVSEHAPLAAGLLRREDYAEFFGRKPFGGAVVVCDQIAFDEWVLLVGDAAHSVIPPTGEGVNSGLEDARLLADHAATGSETWFADFETKRLPDLHALGAYAWTLKDNVRSTDPARSAANVVLRIVDTLAGKLHLPSAQVEARLFGPDSGLEPYREAIGPWRRQRQTLFEPVRAMASVIAKATEPLLKADDDSEVEIHAAGAPDVEAARRIVVVGGTRGTGRELVDAAVEAGHEVVVVSRSGGDIPGALVVQGDATDVAVVREAVEGADAVVVTVGGTKSDDRARTHVTEAVVAATKDAGVKRLVVQTSLGAGDSAEQLPGLLRVVTPKILAVPLADHNAQEDVVRASGLDWTIVRPAGLSNGDATRQWQTLRQGESGTLTGKVRRADVALAILDVLADDSTIGAELGVSGV